MANPLKRFDSFQYPSAHYGHLSDLQQTKLDEFKALCQEKGYYTPTSNEGQPSHSDETLLRYLRARKFNPQDGFGQFKETEDWRKDNKVDEYYETIDIGEYENARRLYPQWTGRRDKRGIPVYLFSVLPLNTKAISAYESSLKTDKSPPLNKSSPTLPTPKLMRLIALYEHLTSFVGPLCSSVTKSHRPHPETPVSQSNNIVDITNVGLRQFWNLKNHMQDASTLATARYPETLDRIFIIGAPSFFPTVWSWIKRWFDPVTVSKIFILSQPEVLPTLSKFIDVENIPQMYGGELDFKWGDSPKLETDIADSLEWVDPTDGPRSVPGGPIRWRKSSQPGRLDLVQVGSEDGKPRNKVIATTKPNIDTAAMAGFQSLKNEPVDWKKDQIGEPLDGVATHESVEKAESHLKESGVNVEAVGEKEAEPVEQTIGNMTLEEKA